GEIQADGRRDRGIWAPHGEQPGLQEKVAELRQAGERVIAALPGQVDADAAQLGCDRILRFANDGWQVDELQV
ncbi:MAG: ATP phosphoribosyltransferase regulatory subunit, partial [Pseudomonadaceae bacterium]|nr:ATP phosphoribosyltransferase regulatory subunit [Pseudomonadaceae bacterium]